ncbi:MAG: PIG-L family deacetylase [Bacteroidota bacterium]
MNCTLKGHSSFLFLSLSLLIVRPVLAQPNVELSQLSLDLSNVSVLLALSAHPDDEDGATLAYYRMKYGVKTYSVFFTRGEGGQNEIGPELYKDLGVIRTHETEEAASVLGSEVYFLNFIDFGFSKTATETFKEWGGRRTVLERLVYIIRKLKPDVIITNHNTIDGHGNHQVVAITATEAFDAAADPTFAPEQLREDGVDLWQPKKLFWRSWTATREPVDVVNAVGERDTLRHQSYQEMALSALSMHKSQGMDRFALMRMLSPSAKTYYRLIRSSSRFSNDSTNLFGGIEPLRDDPALAGVGEELHNLVPSVLPTDESEREHFLDQVHATLEDSSMMLYRHVEATMESNSCSRSVSPLRCRTVGIWDQALQRLVGSVLGLSIHPEVSDSIVVPGERFSVKIGDVSPTGWDHRMSFNIDAPQGWFVEKNGDEFTLGVPLSATPTVPLAEGLYRTYRSSSPLKIEVTFTDISRFSIGVPVTISIAPQQTLTVEPKACRYKERGNEFQFTVHNYFNNKTAGRIGLDLPKGWTSTSADFIIDKEDGDATGKLTVYPDQNSPDGDYRIVMHAHGATDTVTVRKFGVQVAQDLTVGVIKSYDNTIESALQELGTKFKLLDEKDLQSDLQNYASVIVDIRAYLVRNDLKRNNARLLEYVKNGGNLIVMYQKDFEWKSEYAPYPLKISRLRVVDETAPIRVLVPDHPLFSFPNKISTSDWDGWVQERGLYFPTEYSKDYLELLSCNDPDEKPLTGGYLVAHYGKGTYIYTSYVWYRQWKEAHPGALRNLANMICLPLFQSHGANSQ